jgi:ureidoglycolate lyase
MTNLKKVESQLMISTATATAPERKTGERLIRAITLIVQEMTPEAFAPYGEIIGERGQVDLDLDGGKASFVAQTVEERPFRFNFFARHQRTEQVFVPLGGSQSIIAVAPPCENGLAAPNIERMQAFLVDGSSAFKLHRGAWHTSAFPLDESATFMVLDRENTLEEDYDLRDLTTTLGVVVEIRQ